MDLQAGIIYKTKDYSKFIVDSEYNRDISKTNVNKIMLSIKRYGDYGHCYPIVVDDNFRIIDGQHRFKAREALGLTIYYIQDIELDSKKLGGINDATSKWKSEAYQKVAKDSKLIKLLESEARHLPAKLSNVVTLLNLFSVRKYSLLDPEMESKKIELIQSRIKPLIWVSNELKNKITDFDSPALSGLYILRLALKIMKFNVKMEQIPQSTYSGILSKLYADNLIK